MATITEDYVSFETAKLLKEKGFVENCLMRYNKVGDLVEETYKFNWNFQTIDYSAPTIQMAMKWLREIHNLIIYVKLVNDGDLYHDAWGFAIYNKFTKESIKGCILCFEYEQACESAIKYCLENLI